MSFSLQTSTINNSLICTTQLISVIGENFTTPTTRTQYPYIGALGYDQNVQLLYFGDGTNWVEVQGPTGSTGATGHTGANGIQGPTGPQGPAFTPTVIAPTVASDQNGIQVGSNQLNLEFADASHNGIASTVAQSFTGVKTFISGVAIDNMPAAMIPFYNTTGTNGDVTFFNQNDSSIGTLTPIPWNGGGGIDQSAWNAQKVGRIVTLGIGLSVVPLAGSAAPLITAAAGSIPPPYVPLHDGNTLPIFLTNNGVRIYGYIQIFANGSITLSLDAASTQGFTGTAGPNYSTVTYTV